VCVLEQITNLSVLGRVQMKFHGDSWNVRKPLYGGVLVEGHTYYQVCKNLKETSVFLRLLTQRIKDNGKTVQRSGGIADCKGTCSVGNVGELINSCKI
jgi:hypothetical protein